MADFETFADVAAVLKSWEARPPRDVLPDAPEWTVVFGERHGSWVLGMKWWEDGLVKAGEFALTNPEMTRDTETDAAIVSARSSASSQRQYVSEVIYNRRRQVGGLSVRELRALLAAAVTRAAGYSDGSLVNNYSTGTGQPDLV